MRLTRHGRTALGRRIHGTPETLGAYNTLSGLVRLSNLLGGNPKTLMK